MMPSGIERPAILCLPTHIDRFAGLQMNMAGRVRYLHDEIVMTADADSGAHVIAQINQLLDLCRPCSSADRRFVALPLPTAEGPEASASRGAAA